MPLGSCDPSTGVYRRGEQPLLDRYTIGHAAIGGVYGALGLPWHTALLLVIGWEVIENPLKDRIPELFPDSCHDTIENAVADAAASMVVWALVTWWRGRSTTAPPKALQGNPPLRPPTASLGPG